MGMYTELNIAVDLSRAPKDSEFIKAIDYMAADSREGMEKNFDMSHPLFKTSRWDYIPHCGSAYFNSANFVSWKYPYLTVIFNMKNYGSELELFLDFIAPHVKWDGYIGTMRYEESESPTLIYILNKKPLLQYVETPEGI